ncbi:SLATT domain-containing protein [Streptomyces hirsutus]|uniref:SLATT domain-containing protein n=1 Tax=Streptomyces hirsutus TaxID=35620 RepID=UPI00369FA50E
MTSNGQSPGVRAADVQAIRESFGRVVYSHKTHEKAREIEARTADRVKWVNIVLITLTSGTLLSSVVSDQKILLYVSAAVSAAAFAFTVFQLSFNPEKSAEQHRATAKELWYIRERYINLLADITSGNITDIQARRDQLIEELRFIYRFAPDTSSSAYIAAQKALQINEEMTFSTEEIDQFLPEALRLGR